MTLTSQIARVMADGRERTINDILRKVPGKPEDVQTAVFAMVRSKHIASRKLSDGRTKITIYRQRKVAAE